VHEDRQAKGPSALAYRSLPVRHWDRWLPAIRAHLLAFDAQGGSRVDLTPEVDRELREAAFAVTPDGRAVVTTWRAVGPDGIESASLCRFDLEQGTRSTLATARCESYGRPALSPDGAWVAALCERRHRDRAPTVEPHLVPLEGGSVRTLALGEPLHPRELLFGADAETLVLAAEAGWHAPVFLLGIETGELVRVTAPSAGGSHEGLRLAPDDAVVYGIRHGTFAPPEPFACRLAAEEVPRSLGGLSGFESTPASRAAAPVRFERLQVRVRDGTPVEVGLLLPGGTGPHPLVTWVHGGPLSAWRDGWHWRWNPLVFVAQGYAVALPNPAGSTGYGAAMADRIWGNVWGEACFHDLMDVQDALEARPEIDARRTGVMGGSFGGYMANWIGTQTDRFRCIVTHASLFDLRAFYGRTDHPAWFALEMGGVPWALGESFDRYAPAAHVEGWRTPTLILHGERDYRVPVGEGLALFSALVTLGVEAELVVYPDENHWIRRPRNIEDWYGRCLDFLRRHLG
ncbi:MAG: S9 family peptidase, partial [Deltaproteobacteria bacterium]